MFLPEKQTSFLVSDFVEQLSNQPDGVYMTKNPNCRKGLNEHLCNLALFTSIESFIMAFTGITNQAQTASE